MKEYLPLWASLQARCALLAAPNIECLLELNFERVPSASFKRTEISERIYDRSTFSLERSIPESVAMGVLSGKYGVHGGVIGDGAGRIVRHLSVFCFGNG